MIQLIITIMVVDTNPTSLLNAIFVAKLNVKNARDNPDMIVRIGIFCRNVDRLQTRVSRNTKD